MIKSPTTPCVKCGNHVWDGPKWVEGEPSFPVGYGKDYLTYRCLGCGWVMYVAPLDRAKAPHVCDQPGE
jgi:hypothetical protein